MARIIVTGTIGRDAEVKTIKEKEYAVFSIAEQKSKDETIWYDVLRRVNGENKSVQYWKKGAIVMVDGELFAKAYEGQKGLAVGLTISNPEVSIIRFAPKEEGEGAAPATPAAPATSARAAAPTPAPAGEDNPDDDLPF